VTKLRINLDENDNIERLKRTYKTERTAAAARTLLRPEQLYFPVVEKGTIRAVPTAAAIDNLHVEKWDVESVIPHGNLPAGIDMYLRQPTRPDGTMTLPECVVKIGFN
jgi:hypothetical protein